MSEVQRAFKNNRIIIPFRIENIEPSKALEYFIGNAHWLDAITPPLEQKINELVKVVNINLNIPINDVAPHTTYNNFKGLIPRKYLYSTVIVILLIACFSLFFINGGLLNIGSNDPHIITPTPVPTMTPIKWDFSTGYDGWSALAMPATFDDGNPTEWHNNYVNSQGVITLDACKCPWDDIGSRSAIYQRLTIPINARNLLISVLKSDYGGDMTDGGLRIIFKSSQDDNGQILYERVIKAKNSEIISIPFSSQYLGKSEIIQIEAFGAGSGGHDGCPCGGTCCFESVGIDSIEMN